MENKNIVLLRHHPMDLKYTNSLYVNQLPDIGDYIVIDVTSRAIKNKKFMEEHPTFVKDLSPLQMGPITGNDGAVASTLEVLYQCSKIYPCHDYNGKPNSEYFKWRNEMFSKPKISKKDMRHTNETLGYSHSDTRYFLHYDKVKKEYIPLNWVDSRKLFYVPTYAKYVVNTESYKWLKSLVDSGKKIALVDFDGLNYYSDNAKIKRYDAYVNKCKKNGYKPKETVNDFLNIKTMNDFYNCTFLSTGHASILKMLLEGDIEVDNNGEVVDKIGVLKV